MTTDSTNDFAGYSFGDARYAIYAVPPLGSRLKALGDAWLGRDPDADERNSQPVVEGLHPERLQEITKAPRHYGFHATLKAPFGLAPGEEAGVLEDELRAFAERCRPFRLRLKVDSLAGFIALVPAESAPAPAPEIEALAADTVRDFDRFRAPLSAEDRARRHPDRLSAREREHLDRWGYPYVLDGFRFHMTLTDRLDEPEHGQVKALLQHLFAPVLAEPMPVAELALFAQAHRAAPFHVVSRFRFESR